jgi:AcrR family transcriptional regulator
VPVPADEIQQLIRVFRRDQVVTTALKIFGRTGSLDASMEEIAAEAGVSRSTVYNHFKDRDALLAACAELSYHRLAAAMQKSLEGDDAPHALLTRFFAAAFASLDENPGFYRLATTLRATKSEAEAVLGTELSAASWSTREQIQRLVERLGSSEELAFDPDVAGSVIGMLLAGALQQRSAAADPRPPMDAANEIAAVVLLGLTRR